VAENRRGVTQLNEQQAQATREREQLTTSCRCKRRESGKQLQVIARTAARGGAEGTQGSHCGDSSPAGGARGSCPSVGGARECQAGCSRGGARCYEKDLTVTLQLTGGLTQSGDRQLTGLTPSELEVEAQDHQSQGREDEGAADAVL
jgi:hypothetical protein